MSTPVVPPPASGNSTGSQPLLPTQRPSRGFPVVAGRRPTLPHRACRSVHQNAHRSGAQRGGAGAAPRSATPRVKPTASPAASVAAGSRLTPSLVDPARRVWGTWAATSRRSVDRNHLEEGGAPTAGRHRREHQCGLLPPRARRKRSTAATGRQRRGRSRMPQPWPVGAEHPDSDPRRWQRPRPASGRNREERSGPPSRHPRAEATRRRAERARHRYRKDQPAVAPDPEGRLPCAQGDRDGRCSVPPSSCAAPGLCDGSGGGAASEGPG